MHKVFICECENCNLNEENTMPYEEYKFLSEIRGDEDEYIVWKTHLNDEVVINESINLYLVKEKKNV